MKWNAARGFTAKFEHFMALFYSLLRVYTIENCRRFLFDNNMKKIEKNALVTSDVMFIFSTPKDNNYKPINARESVDS